MRVLAIVPWNFDSRNASRRIGASRGPTATSSTIAFIQFPYVGIAAAAESAILEYNPSLYMQKVMHMLGRFRSVSKIYAK